MGSLSSFKNFSCSLARDLIKTDLSTYLPSESRLANMSSSGKSGGGHRSARLPQGSTASGSPSSKKSKGSSGKDRNGEGSSKKSSSEQDPSKKQKSKAAKPSNTGSTGKATENRDYEKPGPPGYNGPTSLTSSVDSPELLALTKNSPLSYEQHEAQLMLYVGMSRNLTFHDLSLIWGRVIREDHVSCQRKLVPDMKY